MRGQAQIMNLSRLPTLSGNNRPAFFILEGLSSLVECNRRLCALSNHGLTTGNEFRIVFGVLIGEVRLLLTAEMLEEIR
jgi:hypothetical protein